MKLQVKAIKGTDHYMVEYIEHNINSKRFFLKEPKKIVPGGAVFLSIESKEIGDCIFESAKEANEAINKYKELRKSLKPTNLEMEEIVDVSFPIVEFD